ncbi:MAG: CpsD/CapB family tyrosine-protein kinase [Oscillospiraceae bacterium]|jgi:capsular exopolysaccharide synthesis family protein|nr:CpsD/CapB family tyrosine-protein kinase [Oscillospiraceae bacterium]
MSKHKGRAKNLTIHLETAPFKYQEAVNSLRTNLKFLSMSGKCNCIVVTSSILDEGKSVVSINLALSLALSGSNVLLIDCDLRKPSLHRYLNIPTGTSRGLTNVLSRAGMPENIPIHMIKKGFSVLTSGVVPPNPAEVLGSPMMGSFIQKMSQLYDYVIMDTAPVSIVTDAAALSQYADGVLLVVRQKWVTFEQARRAKKNLEAVGANLLGVVLNGFDIRKADNAGDYYYGYYQNY